MTRLLMLACALLAGAALAQTSPLREDQVTERAVLEALGVRPPDSSDAAASGVRTRGFRPATSAATSAATRPGAAAPARQAPLLITFVPDSAELMPSARSALDVVARALRTSELSSASFRIEGHADPRGGEAHNQDLSRRRAESVVSYLVREHNLPGERLQAVGKGATELLNERDKLAPENRRVTIVVR